MMFRLHVFLLMMFAGLAGLLRSASSQALTERWRTSLTDTGKAPRSRPLVVGNRVFLVASKIEAFNTHDGTLLWETGVHGSIPEGLVAAAGLLCTADTEAYCLRPDTGAVVWSAKLDDDASLATAASDGKLLVLGTEHHSVQAFDIRNGGRLWSTDVDPGGAFRTIVTGQTIADGMVYVAVTRFLDQDGAHTKGALLCLDMRDGQIRWASALPQTADRSAATGPPLVIDGAVVLTDRLANRVVSISTRTHQVLWMFAGSGGFAGMADGPVLDGKQIDVASGDRHVYALDAVSGAQLWSREIGGSVLSLTRCEGFLIASDGELSVLHRSSGEMVYRDVDTMAPARISSGIFSSEGHVYFASRDALVSFSCTGNGLP